MPKVIQNGSRNPILVVEPDEVLAWLRSLADAAGLADRETCAVQISAEQPFGGGTKIHNEPPKLIYMVSNIPNSSRK